MSPDAQVLLWYGILLAVLVVFIKGGPTEPPVCK